MQKLDYTIEYLEDDLYVQPLLSKRQEDRQLSVADANEKSLAPFIAGTEEGAQPELTPEQKSLQVQVRLWREEVELNRALREQAKTAGVLKTKTIPLKVPQMADQDYVNDSVGWDGDADSDSDSAARNRKRYAECFNRLSDGIDPDTGEPFRIEFQVILEAACHDLIYPILSARKRFFMTAPSSA